MNQNSKFKIQNSSGFSTLELLIAIAILVTAISGSVLVVFGGMAGDGGNPIIFQNQTISLDNQANNEALALADSLMEHAWASASADFNSLSDISDYDFFRQEFDITDINPCKKSGVASVSWSTDQNRPQLINLNTTFTNFAEALALGGDCGPNSPPATEWWFPLTFEDYDIGAQSGPMIIQPPSLRAGNSGVGATSVDFIEKNGSKYVILTAQSSSEDDLWIINVDDGHNAFIVSSLETKNLGLNNADAAGNLVFALTAGSYNTKPSELQIINISDLSVPSLVATKSLGISGTDSSNNPNAGAIYSYDGKVYVGAHRTGGSEFKIFSATAPFNLLGSLEINHNVNDIIVSGDYAYLATSDDGDELMIIDISDPTNLTHPNPSDPAGKLRFDMPGLYDGKTLFYLSNKIYIGRERASEANDSANPNFYILDVSNPTLVVELGSKRMTRNPSQVLDILTVHVVSHLAFIGTNDSNPEFQVFRIDNPLDIKNCNEAPPAGYTFPPEGCGRYDFPAKVTDIEFHDNYIYASIESNATFRILWDDLNKY